MSPANRMPEDLIFELHEDDSEYREMKRDELKRQLEDGSIDISVLIGLQEQLPGVRKDLTNRTSPLEDSPTLTQKRLNLLSPDVKDKDGLRIKSV